MPPQFTYRYYVTPNVGSISTEPDESITIPHSQNKSFEPTFYWFTPCFGALCVGFSLVGLFTLAIMLPASLSQIHKTCDYVTVHANVFKVQTNSLWLDLTTLQKQWRARRDKFEAYLNKTELPMLPSIALPFGFIPFPFHRFQIRRRPKPADRFIPNDSSFDNNISIDDVTENATEYPFTVTSELNSEFSSLPRTTVTTRPLVRITIMPRTKPLLPLSADSFASERAQRVYNSYTNGDNNNNNNQFNLDSSTKVNIPANAYSNHQNNPPPYHLPTEFEQQIFYPPPPPMPSYTKSSGQTSKCVGPPGPPGQDGLDAPDGSDGSDGAPGTDAIFERFDGPCQICPHGPPGPIGLPGPVGNPGYHGQPGHAGSNGVAGGQSTCHGQKGEIGSPGAPGPDGLRGFHGMDWISGVGSPGLPGGPGLSGPVGPSGLTGRANLYIGLPGPVGPPGQDGHNGPTGPDGPYGLTGEPGVDKGYCPCPIRKATGQYPWPRQSNFGFGRL